MKKSVIITLVSLLILSSSALPPSAAGEVNVNVAVPLPGLVIPAPPPLLVVPGTYVYYPPDVDVDIFFYHGYWYRPHGGRWYRAGHYNGPWRSIEMRRIPGPVLNLPPHFRSIPPRHDHAPYNTVRKNWRAWERDRHWDRGEHRGRSEGERRGGHREHGEGGHGRGR
jgi:hypothetical protein